MTKRINPNLIIYRQMLDRILPIIIMISLRKSKALTMLLRNTPIDLDTPKKRKSTRQAEIKLGRCSKKRNPEGEVSCTKVS